MARRQLTIEEIGEYRSTQREQLRRLLLAGEDTRPVRRALSELDQQEAELRLLKESARGEQSREMVARAADLAAASGLRILATVAALECPEMPA